jgi:hypothetical protein
MAQVRNTLTGQVLTIPDSEVRNMSSQWKVVSGSASATPAPAQLTYVNNSGTRIPVGQSQFGYHTAEDLEAQGYRPEGTASGSSGTSSGSTSGGSSGGSTAQDPMTLVLDQIQAYLDKLATLGQTINPNVEITPAKAAEFLSQAEREIDPYFASQLKLAKEGFMRSIGYTAEDITRNEKEMEKKYGQTVRQLGSSLAEAGMTLSGERNLQEQNLAQDTQSQMDQNRRLASFNAGTAARQFAGEWGSSAVQNAPNIAAAPRVLAGQESFASSGSSNPFYELSPDVYNGLTGSQQWNRQTQVRSRAAELENAWRQSEYLKSARALTI